jgi:hypothetical protein
MEAGCERIAPTAEERRILRGIETLAVGNRLDLAAARSQLQSAAGRWVGENIRFIGALDFGFVGEHEPDGAILVGPSFRFELPIFNQGQHASPAAKLNFAWRREV